MSDFLNKIKTFISEINNQCFNGKLNTNFLVKISNTSRNSAHVSFIGKRNDMFSPMFYYVKSLSVSKNFNWTDEELKNTIIHELIHVYEAQILKRKPSHSHYFKSKMNEINSKFGYSVGVKHSMKTTKSKKITQVKYLLSEDKSKIVFLSKSLYIKIILNRSVYSSSFGNFTTGKISSDKISKYRVSRSLRYSYKMDQLKLQELGIV